MCGHPVSGSACHCSACHRTFTSVSAFDQHQRWDAQRKGKIICLDPVVARDAKGREIFTVEARRGYFALASHGHVWRQ